MSPYTEIELDWLTRGPQPQIRCPDCGGHDHQVLVGIATDGTWITSCCPRCGGAGTIPEHLPSLEWEECPHCDGAIPISHVDLMAADECPSCGGFFFLGVHGIDGIEETSAEAIAW